MRLSRRSFLHRHAVVLAAASLPGILGACTAASPPAPTAAPPTAPLAARPAPSAPPAAPAPSVSPAASPVGATGSPAAAGAYGPGWKLSQPAHVAVIQSGALVAAPVFLAQELGLFNQFGLDVDVNGGNPADVGALMIRGDIKAVLASPSAATWSLIARDPNAFAFIAGDTVVAPDGTGSVGVLARKDLFDAGTIKTVADLRGKRLGVAALWDGLAYETAYILRDGGLALDQVDRVELGSFPSVIAALQGGSVEAAAIFEPLLSAAVAQKSGVLLSQKAPPAFAETYLWANRAWATGQVDQAVAFLSGFLLAQRLLRQKGLLDPTIEPIVEKYTKLAAPQLQQQTVPPFAPNGSLRPEDLDTYQSFYASAPGQPLGNYTKVDVRQQIDTTALAGALRVVGQE